MKSPLARKISRLIRWANQVNLNEGRAWRAWESQRLGRREFLGTALKAGAGLMPLVGLLEACATQPIRKVEKKLLPSIPILGAGIAGLTAAHYLSQAGIPCAVYEGSARFGGRMFTKSNFNEEGMFCELGGEFVDSNHADLIELCKYFQIPLTDFRNIDKNLEWEVYYIHGKRYTDHELIPLFQPLAKRLAADQERLFSAAGNAASPAPNAESQRYDRMSLAAYLRSIHNVEPWILDMLRIAWIGEIGTEAEEQPALYFISSIAPDTSKGFKLFGESDQVLRIQGGNKTLIDALVASLTAQGVPLHLGEQLVAMQEQNGNLRLSFASASGTKQISAAKVICAMPFSALRNVEGVADLPIDPLKKDCIANLGYGTNGKLIMDFHEPYWSKQPYKKDTQGLGQPSNGMVYSDLAVQNLWDTSRGQAGKSGVLTSFLGGNAGKNISPEALPDFLKCVEKIFPGTQRNFSGRLATWNWSNYSFSLGSYAAPKLGQITKYYQVAQKTEMNGRLVFAGEHAADAFNGFMNGACRSGRVAAEAILRA